MDKMEMSFDRLGVHYIDPSYWIHEQQSKELAGFLTSLLEPNPGRAWFRSPDGDWIPVTPDRWEAIQGRLEDLVGIWSEGCDGLTGYREFLAEKGECAVFLDAERFSALGHSEGDLPETFYVGFGVEWRFLPNAGVSCLTPPLRVTNYWPEAGSWVPPGALGPPPEPSSVQEAQRTLAGVFWADVMVSLLEAGFGHRPGRVSIDLGFGELWNPIYFYASPTRREERAEAYLQGPSLRALNALCLELLKSSDLRSTEITGGVLEGCVAVFNHSPGERSSYNLMLPLAGFEEQQVEVAPAVLVRGLHYVDLDAAHAVLDITHELERSRSFSSIWSGSAKTGIGLLETLYTLLPKISIQDRMYSLAHLMSGFLAKLQAKAYADSMKRKELRRTLESSMEASRRLSENLFTVQKIPGLELLGICEGRTRANRGFARTLEKAAETAETLAEQITRFSRSLSHTAELEERKQEREKKRLLAAEEKAAKRLNLVLAAVAGLAAIPLVFGPYDTQALISEVGDWFPFDYGVQISFAVAFSTLLGILLVLGFNRLTGRSSLGEPESPLVRRVGELSNAVFDGYRGYDHDSMQGLISQYIRPQAFGRGTWGNASEAERAVRAELNRLDRALAHAAAAALDQASDWWHGADGVPTSDEAWARDMERRVCGFVLLGDLFDLRPEDLRLPLTTALYRFKHEVAGLMESPVSVRGFQDVMNGFGYSDEEVEAIEAWGGQEDVRSMTAQAFIQVAEERGVTALHEDRITA